MATFNIEILNPKAKKLLMDLADLRLISISESVANPFLDAVRKIRSKNAQLSLADITKEVENIRSKRNGK
jgi:anti-anti-sigma regulatory factor